MNTLAIKSSATDIFPVYFFNILLFIFTTEKQLPRHSQLVNFLLSFFIYSFIFLLMRCSGLLDRIIILFLLIFVFTFAPQSILFVIYNN